MDNNNPSSPDSSSSANTAPPQFPPKKKSAHPLTKESLQKMINNPLLNGISGKFGSFSIRMGKDGKRYVVERPPGERAFNGAQKAQQERFKAAAAYAKAVLADPEQRGLYEAVARKRMLSPHNVAMQAYLRPPVITAIITAFYTGSKREHIAVFTTDREQLSRMQVEIRNSAGALLERGAATQPTPRAMWTYFTRKNLAADQLVQIEAIATARAGHVVRKAVSHQLRSRPDLPEPRQRPVKPRKLRTRSPAAVWCPDI